MSRWLGTACPVLAAVALFVCPVGGAGDTCTAPAEEADVITAAVASLTGLPKNAGVCPRTCRTCGCDDDSAAAAAIHASVVSCEAAFAANDFSCSEKGPFFNTAAAGSSFNTGMVEAFAAACRKSCRACHHPHSCRDYSSTCRASVAADRNGTCSRTVGPRFGGAAASADDVVACAAACGACAAAPGAPEFCLDHDTEFTTLVPHFASCAAARAAYGGRCDDVAARHAGDPAAFANVSVAAPLVELYLRSMCAHECGFCSKAPATIYAVTTEAGVMPGGEYHLQDRYVTCEDTAVWALSTTTPLRYYVYSLDGRWTVGKDVAGRSLLDLEKAVVGNASLCSLLEPSLRVAAPYATTVDTGAPALWPVDTVVGPFETRLPGGEWAAVAAKGAFRFQPGGCKAKAQCLQHKCFEPDEDDGKTCDQCWADKAFLKCEDEDSKTGIILTVVFVAVILIVTLYAVVRGVERKAGVADSGDDENDKPHDEAKKSPTTTPTPRASGVHATMIDEEPKEEAKRHPFLVRYRLRFIHFMGRIGELEADHSVTCFMSTLIILATMAVTGLPLAETETGSHMWVPEGSRINSEIDFYTDWTDTKQKGDDIIFMVGPEKDGDNALNKKTLTLLQDMLERMMKIRVPMHRRNGSVYMASVDDFCANVDNVKLREFVPHRSPCVLPSMLDCFYEGHYLVDTLPGNGTKITTKSASHKALDDLWAISEAATPGHVSRWEDNESFYNLTQQGIYDVVSQRGDTCKHWLSSSTKSNAQYLGGFTLGTDKVPGTNYTRVTGARKLNAILVMKTVHGIATSKYGMEEFTKKQIEDAIRLFEEALEDEMEKMNDDEDGRISLMMGSSITRMYEEVGKSKTNLLLIGYAIMFVYVCFTTFSSYRPENLALVGIIGMIIVLIANLGGFGLIATFRIKYNHVMLQALPYLSLGLGVDDMFLLINYYKMIDKEDREPRDVLRELFREAGISVTLTSFCNAFSFFCGMIVPIPALRKFLGGAGIMCLTNYAAMFVCFPAVLAWDVGRTNRALRRNAEQREAFERLRQEKLAAMAPVGGLVRPAQAGNDPAALPNPHDIPHNGCCGCCSVSSEDIVASYFSPFMRKRAVQITLTVVNFVLLVLLVISLTSFKQFTYGFELEELSPRGSFLAQGFRDFRENIEMQASNHKAVFRSVDYERELPRYFRAVDETRNNPQWATPSQAWVWAQYFLEFAHAQGKVNSSNGNYDPLSVDFKGGGTVLLTPYSIKPEDVYPTLWMWRDPYQGIPSISSSLTDNFGYDYGNEARFPQNHIQFSVARYSLDKRQLLKPKEWVEHSDAVRESLNAIMGRDANGHTRAFPAPTGIYLQAEEFTSLTGYFWMALVVSAVVVFVSAIIVPVSVRGAFLIAITSVISTVEVAAFLMLCGLSFSALVAVALLIGMGITVEFTAHIVTGFEHHRGSRSERLHTALVRTVVPVCEGAISSVLSFIILAFSPFPYVTKYFFFVFFIVILFGIVHGLFFLPALLGLFGSSDPPADGEHDRLGSATHFGAGAATPMTVSPTGGTRRICVEPEPPTETKPPPVSPVAAPAAAADASSPPAAEEAGFSSVMPMSPAPANPLTRAP